jgi:curved DNA-binding protein
MAMDFKDYYATLGVSKTASDKEIKQAFRKLARKFHPDVNPGDKAAESRFKEINEAHEVLANPETRKKYDELGSNWKMYEQAQARGGASPFGGGPGPGSGRGGYRTVSESEMEDLFGDSHPFSDFFTTFFGGAGNARGGRPTRRPRAGRDLEHEIDLSLEDAYRGATRKLALQHDGQSRTVDVRIPAGVADGSRVRVAGEGERGETGTASGDLFLRVRLAPHASFERKGQDLYVHVAVPVTTAVLGGQVNVPTLGDAPARLRVPPLTQNGQVFRLKGYGMPSVGSQDKGHLYATVDAQLPRELTAEAREHYAALARLADGPSEGTV